MPKETIIKQDFCHKTLNCWVHIHASNNDAPYFEVNGSGPLREFNSNVEELKIIGRHFIEVAELIEKDSDFKKA